MATQKSDYTCAVICWGIGVLLGIMTTAGLMVVGWSFLQGAFMGVLAWLIVGGVLSVAVCSVDKKMPSPAEARTKLEADMAEARARVQGGATVPAKPAPVAAAPVAEAPAAKAPAKPASEPEPAPKADHGPKVAASAALAGEAELASRKGSWKYENGDAAPAASAPSGKPESLSAPRDGGADDLKKIKGVGPKLEQLLHSLGFYHFDQIANWSASDVDWVDQNLEGFKGRATRDEWVAQAKTLASGGDTAFSKRVEDGDVY
ncbi:endonuclease [Tropicimonas sp. S265A]|uniref:endonuclease n=1 Tax=Tropicimonas sp. S265A TaxID=3415134 RepID=UPI003C7BCDB6